MPAPILATKLYIPQPRSSVVPRPRLIERLQASLQGPLTLISAPAGSGKTTVLGQWRRGPGSAVPVSWLSLDSADNDLTRFLQYLSAALDILEPGLEEEVRPLLQSSEPPNGEAVLTLLINRLSGLEEDAVLALDDLHLIENPVIHTALAFLLEHLPPRLHLVILSRADPPLPLARLRARGQLVELRAADLRFSVEECAQFLNQIMDLDLTGEQVAALEKRTEGWIAGLQLAALSMHAREDRQGFILAFTGSNHYIVDYLAEEVLVRQPEPLRQFLLRTCILDRMTGPLCDALTGEQDGEDFLKQLERANLFVIPLDDEQRWYRYHHLFSDLLRLRLEKSHPGLSSGLHGRACAWFEAQDMLPEALQHAISSGDMKLAARIVSDNVLMLSDNDEVMPLLHKIDSLPAENLTALPWLGIARAWIVAAGDVGKTEKLLEDIEVGIKDSPGSNDIQTLRGHISAVWANLFAVRGEWDSAIARARQAMGLLPADEVVVRSRCLTTWGRALVNKKQHSEALPIFEQALALARQADKAFPIIYAAASLAITYFGMGRMHDPYRTCLDVMDVIETFEKRLQHPLSSSAEIYAFLSRIYVEWGEIEKAIEYAQKGLMLSERWGHDVFTSECLCYLGRAYVLGNDMKQARNIFQRVDQITRKISPWVYRFCVSFNLESLLDAETASPVEINSLARQVQENGEVPTITKARLLLRDNQPGETLAALERAMVEWNTQPTYSTVWIYNLQALAFRAMGKMEDSLAALRQALELAEPENRVYSFLREGFAMESLLRLALEKSISPRFVRQLLTAFEARRRHGLEPAPAAQALLEPLSARELDVLKLLARGCPDKKIAETLVIARETVHKHLKNIYGKLGVHSRTEAIARARELDLL